MALEIRTGVAAPVGIIADRRLWLTRDREAVVEDGSPDAAILLAAGSGDLIPQLEAARLRLELVDGKVIQRQAEAMTEAASPPSGDVPSQNADPIVAGDDNDQSAGSADAG